MNSNYDILGIPQTAKKEDIKKAYRKLCMIYHPDKPNGNSEKFMRIKSAYEQLMVPNTTLIHDQYQHRTAPYAYIISNRLFSNGDAVFTIAFKNLSYAEALGQGLDGMYHWPLFGKTYGTLVIKKEHLIKAEYNVKLKFTPIIGASITKEYQFDDPRSWWTKMVDKIKVKFDDYLP